MKKIYLAALVLGCFQSHAHLEIGVYRGEQGGESCEIKVNKVYFENDMRHPLNERAEMEVLSKKFIVYHPPKISSSPVMATYDHDQFQGYVAKTGGAEALIVEMLHSEDSDGPSQFHWVDHNYKSGEKTMKSCKNLKFIGK